LKKKNLFHHKKEKTKPATIIQNQAEKETKSEIETETEIQSQKKTTKIP
jgi:hypothetical protein